MRCASGQTYIHAHCNISHPDTETSLPRFVADLLYNLLRNKLTASCTKARSNGVRS